MLPRLANLFDHPSVVTQESSLQESGEGLHPEELAMMSGCVEKRRRELAASRQCARKALATLGISEFPLLLGPDRSPIWPPGVVGAITHTNGIPGGYCGVALADRRFFSGLGVDAEPRRPLPTDVWSTILDETEHLTALAANEPGIQARLVFSAKETTYKALYPALKRFLEFSDVHIETHCDSRVFRASLAGNASAALPDLGPLFGSLLVDDELIVTAMKLPPAHLALAQEGL